MGEKIIILAIDGGGIRGIIPSYILSQIESRIGRLSHQIFTVIGGTSTGGIITAALSTPKNGIVSHSPYSGAEILNFYMQESDQLFVPQPTWLLRKAKYIASKKGKGIEPFLREKIGDIKLQDAREAISALPNNKLEQMFMTGYTVNSKGGVIGNPEEGVDFGPYLFAWWPEGFKLGENNTEKDNYFVREGARATSAAPSYFPIAHVGGGSEGRSDALERYVIDGGLMSNNPAIWALAEISRLGISKLKLNQIAAKQDEIIVISLGTGQYTGADGLGIHNNHGLLVPKKGNWGGLPWMFASLYDLMGLKNDRLSLLNLALNSVPQVATRQLPILGTRFGFSSFRLEPRLPKELMAMDDDSSEHKDALLQTVKKYLQQGEGKVLFDKVLDAIQ